jgi:hypothetical protein
MSMSCGDPIETNYRSRSCVSRVSARNVKSDTMKLVAAISSRAYWRVTFERADRPVTMSGLSGERFDEFVAGNAGASIATFLQP